MRELFFKSVSRQNLSVKIKILTEVDVRELFLKSISRQNFKEKCTEVDVREERTRPRSRCLCWPASWQEELAA